MKEEDKIMAGILFAPGNPELRAIKMRSHKLSAAYSRTDEDDVEIRKHLLELILGEIGEGTFMQGPIFFHYGIHTKIGKRNFFNYNLTIQDDATVEIGNDNNFGPNCTIVTPIHPMLPDERRTMLDKEYPCHEWYINKDGVPMVGLSVFENLPHGLYQEYARIAWDFMKHYARNQETGEIVYTAIVD